MAARNGNYAHILIYAQDAFVSVRVSWRYGRDACRLLPVDVCGGVQQGFRKVLRRIGEQGRDQEQEQQENAHVMYGLGLSNANLIDVIMDLAGRFRV